MRLKGKILALTLIPVISLGILMFLVAADRIANGIYDEAYVGMEATTLAVREIFEEGNVGPYHMDESGVLWKGETLNISQATNITDQIKESTGMEVTVFWGDTRILTSIVNERGERQINTQASSEVVNHVLKNGETYHNRHVEILGKEYVVCYIPFYQENSNEIVGMVFLGTPQETVSSIINKVRLQFLVIILTVVILVTIAVYLMVGRIVSALKKNMDVLDDIANGMLDVDVEQKLLGRKDEIGDLGRNIVHLKDSLSAIVVNIRNKSGDLSKVQDIIEKQEEDIRKTSEIFGEVCSGVDQSATVMETILENSQSLEQTRADTVAIVQNSAALSEENSASIEEILASIENIYQELGDISAKTKTLNGLSQNMVASVDVF